MCVLVGRSKIIEAKLEHFSILLNHVVEYEQNPFVLDSFSHAIDVLMECRSLSISIKLVVHSWKVIVSDLKEKYKQIFKKKRNCESF